MIYKLELEGGKYYFGLCGMEVRHRWLNEYRILKYEECEGGEMDLIYYVLKFMEHYGFSNVRGGYWQQDEMKNPPPVLGRFRRGKSKYNRCEKCMVYGHDTRKCQSVDMVMELDS